MFCESNVTLAATSSFVAPFCSSPSSAAGSVEEGAELASAEGSGAAFCSYVGIRNTDHAPL